MEIAKRKGARSIKEISPEILIQLNKGEIETANLVEWLAIDQKLLLKNILKELKRTTYYEPIIEKINTLKKVTINTTNEAIGAGLLEQITKAKDKDLINLFITHKADTVRCWGTYLIAKNEQLSLPQLLKQIQPFAADKHFGVREIAWLSVRPIIAKNILESISILSKWSTHKDENIRRFASESTRPRGVWCEHIQLLKDNPAVALPILEPLKNDITKYVQDSVGNWLNDASKSHPTFVIDLCKKWEKESNTKQTLYIIKKALRTLEK